MCHMTQLYTEWRNTYMTIALNNQEVVNLTATEIPYHTDLTIEKALLLSRYLT